MGGDVGRVGLGVFTAGLSEIANAASGGGLFKKEKAEKKSGPAGSSTPEYNIYESGRIGKARKASLLTPESTSQALGDSNGTGKATLLGG